jgi:predicted transcriptional regulator
MSTADLEKSMPQSARTMHIDFPNELQSQVDDLAAQTGRSRTDIVTDAVETYLRNQARWQLDMDTALKDVDDGLGYAGNDVLAWLESWGEDAELPQPSLLRKQ